MIENVFIGIICAWVFFITHLAFNSAKDMFKLEKQLRELRDKVDEL